MVFVYKNSPNLLFGMLCLPGDQSHPFAQPTINPLACCICWPGLLGHVVFPPWNEGPNFGSYILLRNAQKHRKHNSNWLKQKETYWVRWSNNLIPGTVWFSVQKDWQGLISSSEMTIVFLSVLILSVYEYFSYYINSSICPLHYKEVRKRDYVPCPFHHLYCQYWIHCPQREV